MNYKNNKIIIYIFLLLLLLIYIKKRDNNINNNIYVGSEGMGKYGKRLINYLIKLKYPNKNIIWINNNKANIIVRSHFLWEEPVWNNKKKPYIYWSGESYDINNLKYDSKSLYIYSVMKDNIHWVPYCSLIFNYKEQQKLYPFDINRKLCGYCNSNPVKFREDFIDLLADKDTTNGVYALGKCTGTSKKINKKKIDGGYSTNEMYKEYSNYAFIICMENNIENGYITEKILNGYKSGSIPIYWGDSKTVKKLFNPKSFICINDYNTSEECIDYILNLYNDKTNLIKMANEPMFTDNIIPDILQIDNYDNPPLYYKKISNLINI
jgi:hypothetical protein